MQERVLITGASGFLGKHVFKEYRNSDSKIYTLGRTCIPDSFHHEDWDCSNVPKIVDVEYTSVIHIAGKAHVMNKSRELSASFRNVNVLGTKNLLDALDKLSVKPTNVVYISSVSVYGLDSGIEIYEDHPCNPQTPYGRSKLVAEELILKWCSLNKCPYLILRLPLVVGANPPGNLGKLKSALSNGRYLRILGNPAVKSVVLASDVAKLIFDGKWGQGIFNLTDGEDPKFSSIENAISKRVGRAMNFGIPHRVVFFILRINDAVLGLFGIRDNSVSRNGKKIISSLTFSSQKAKTDLGWKPNPVLQFIEESL